MAELPKTTRDPLLASRELLSFNKLNLEKEKVALKVEIQTKRFQKIPMNLFSMENCDILEINNPQFVSVYAKEIFSHLLTVEVNTLFLSRTNLKKEKYSAKYGSLAIVQTEVNERMRAILIDWLVDIHMKFKLLPETLYIAVNLLDRALEKIPIQKQKLQLLGVTTMLIASKYQEIYPPEVKDFVYVADKAYKKEEILEMEGIILNTLQFNLTFPSTLTFLERYTRLAGMDQKSFNFCQYIVELAFLDYKMLKYHSSLITCGAIQLTNKIFKRQGYEDVLVKNTNYTEEQMKLCAKDLLILFKNFEKSSLKAIKRKFLSPQFMEVAKIQIDIL